MLVVVVVVLVVVVVVFTMDDGVESDTWLIKSKKSESCPTLVILHGAGESKANYLDVGRNTASLGYNVLLVDLRHHGRSGGKYITCGAKEKKDIKAIIDTLASEKIISGLPIYLLGFTYGGATAIQYAAIDERVAGMVVFSPWVDTVTKARRDLGLILDEEDFEKKLGAAGKKANFDPFATSAIQDAAKLKCPVYIIHGMGDLVVPVSDSQAIYRQLVTTSELKIIRPGPKQIAIGLDWSSWVSEQVEKMVKGKLESQKAEK